MTEAESRLSPRALLRWLAPSLALDDELVAGFRVTDCYRLSAGEPVRLELQRGAERFEIDVAPVPESAPERTRRAPAIVAGLALGYRPPAPVEVALAACTTLAELIGRSLGSADRRWQVAAPSLCELPDAVADELRCDEVELDADPDAGLLRRDFRSYAWLYAARPRALQVSVAGRRVPGISLHYPPPAAGRIPSAAGTLEVSLRVAHRRRMRRHFGALGFVFDDDAYLRTVPTPTTYARALAGHDELARVRPRLIANHRSTLWHVAWAILVSRNVLPISVAPAHAALRHSLVSRLRSQVSRSSGPSMIQCDVGMPGHDMGVHAAALHAVPRAAWDELLALAIERARARPLGLLGHEGVLTRLAVFFEGPVTKGCWQAWYEADEPSEFAGCYARQHPAIVDELRGL